MKVKFYEERLEIIEQKIKKYKEKPNLENLNNVIIYICDTAKKWQS